MSSAAGGEVCLQLDENGKDLLKVYGNRSLSEGEKNHSAYEREGLAITFAMKTVHYCYLCQKFKLFTDHEALKYAINNKELHAKIP